MKQIIEVFRYLIPYRKISFKTTLSPSQIIDIMQPRIASYFSIWPFKSLVGKFDFIGKITESKICLIPIIKGRFMYLPYTRGSIIKQEKGNCILNIIQTPHPYEITLVLILIASSIYLGVPDFIVVIGILHIICSLFIFRPYSRRVELLINDKLKAKV